MKSEYVLVSNDPQWSDGFLILQHSGMSLDFYADEGSLLDWFSAEDVDNRYGIFILEVEHWTSVDYWGDYDCGYDFVEYPRELDNWEWDDLVNEGYLFWPDIDWGPDKRDYTEELLEFKLSEDSY